MTSLHLFYWVFEIGYSSGFRGVEYIYKTWWYRKRMNMTYGRIWYIKIVSVVVDTCVNIGKFIGLGKCKE